MADDGELVLSPEQHDLLDKFYDDNPIAWMEDNLWIQPKAGGLCRFVLNAPQKRLINTMEEMRKAGLPIRVIILKARQIGFSTAVEAYFAWWLTRHRHTSGLVIAHENDASNKLWQMFVRYLDNLPEAFKVTIKNKNEAFGKLGLGTDNPELIASDPSYGSTMHIESARDKQAGRGGTYQLVHASEVAFWEYQETFLALKQTVGKIPNTVFVEESTPNGAAGQFYEDWDAAWKATKKLEAGLELSDKDSKYRAIFVAWHEYDAYRSAITAEEAAAWAAYRAELDVVMAQYGDAWKKYVPHSEKFDLDEEELDLVRYNNVDYSQLKWRRECLRDECGGDLNKLHQEYAANPEEGFLSSGRPFFDSRQINNAREEIRITPGGNGVKYTIDIDESEAKEEPCIHPDAYGELVVWEEPQKGQTYAIGADVAEGTVDGDFDAGHVVNYETMEHAAQIHGKFDPDIYGKKLYWLGMWYNEALIGCEVNAAGIATVLQLEKMEYDNLWGEGWPIQSRMKEHGWRTNIKTRSPMLTHLKRAFAEKSFKPRSTELLDEQRTFIVNEKGKAEAQRGKCDDLVIAAAITLQMREKAAELAPFVLI